MSRTARIVVPGYPHHVTQRGNRGVNVFCDDSSRRRYLALVWSAAKKYKIDIWAYCLMSNHVHWIVVPSSEQSLAQVFRDAHTAYAQYFNKLMNCTGHLWQGRFFSSTMEGKYELAAVRYVERNPVRAGMVARAEDYWWSSAPSRCGLREDPLLVRDIPPAAEIDDWAEWLRAPEDHAAIAGIRSSTSTGRPCASEPFVKDLERQLGTAIRPKKRGPKWGRGVR